MPILSAESSILPALKCKRNPFTVREKCLGIWTSDIRGRRRPMLAPVGTGHECHLFIDDGRRRRRVFQNIELSLQATKFFLHRIPFVFLRSKSPSILAILLPFRKWVWPHFVALTDAQFQCRIRHFHRPKKAAKPIYGMTKKWEK